MEVTFRIALIHKERKSNKERRMKECDKEKIKQERKREN
jgi:hypothetical protein